ncbi:hydrogenase accessory protein HypB [Gammaproteobacteria bacterium ESL0073]|nr:hydrogenase accessory protein HypB [Gammaproteobacteria bacterium ESL0073]
MCITCGCESDNVSSSETEHHQHTHDEMIPQIVHHHYHHTGDVHHHYHFPATNPAQHHHHEHEHGHTQEHSPSDQKKQQRLIEIEQHVLAKNDQIAAHNREHFADQKILVLNLMSSPGSGKTTLLTETLKRIANQCPCAVIEGDQQTSNDAERIRSTGVQAIQVNTGKGCHLDAQMVHQAAHDLTLPAGGILFIENVGNLVCPASFDLGEKLKVVVMSVTEGDDKPLKYPHMFAAAGLMVINKIDLALYVNFNIEQCIANALTINPRLKVIKLSCTTGEGLDAWLDFLETERCA